MPTEVIKCFCARCNSIVTADVRTTAFGNPTVDMFEHLDPGEEGFRGVRYSLAFCGECGGIFLHRRSETEPSEYVFEEVMYPRNADPLPPEIPALVRRTYDSALSCFETGNYEPCVIMSRKTLEALCRVLGEQEGTLDKRLRHLRDAGTIERKLYDWANELRLIGNDAAHDLDLVFSSEDASDCLEFLKAILLYVFALNERFQQFRTRRKKSAAASKA